MIESQGSLPGMAKMYLIILILAAMIVGAAFLYGQSTAAAPEPSFRTVTFENIFVDINGDGQPDYIHKAEVVINNTAPLSEQEALMPEQQAPAQ
jgi:hypothetical protein